MIDMQKPAGWKEEPGAGLEKSRAMSPADDRAGDAEDRRHPEAEVFVPRHKMFGNKSDDETDDDRPDDVQHRMMGCYMPFVRVRASRNQ